MSVAEADLCGEDWRSMEPWGELGEVVQGLELALADCITEAHRSDGDDSLGRAEPLSCTWTGVKMTVA